MRRSIRRVNINVLAEGVIFIACGDCIPFGGGSRTGLGDGIPGGPGEAGRVGDWSLVRIGPFVGMGLQDVDRSVQRPCDGAVCSKGDVPGGSAVGRYGEMR
jgi:hypothetical protein